MSWEATRGKNLFADQYLYLGGNSGLRGYTDFYQDGDRRYLFSLEQRFYGRREWLSLFYLGYAFFYDQGRTWGDSLAGQVADRELRDFGFGLRFSGTRVGGQDQSRSNILHLDVAKPLDGDSDISDIQWILKVKSSL
jgi:hemolysin activation/secretion protein